MQGNAEQAALAGAVHGQVENHGLDDAAAHVDDAACGLLDDQHLQRRTRSRRQESKTRRLFETADERFDPQSRIDELLRRRAAPQQRRRHRSKPSHRRPAYTTGRLLPYRFARRRLVVHNMRSLDRICNATMQQNAPHVHFMLHD